MERMVKTIGSALIPNPRSDLQGGSEWGPAMVCWALFCLPSEAGKPSHCLSVTKPRSWGIESDSQGRHRPTVWSEGSDRRLMERSVSKPDSASCRGECAKRHDAQYMDNDSQWLRT